MTEPPYHVAILQVTRTGADADGYTATLARMLELAERRPGYLGRRSAVTDDGDELTIVFFTDDEALRAWHDDPEHRAAQHLARERWYERYQVHVARVERTYRFQR
ncbi:antibiotic biosynthesis monooxygenase family protein [Micromonospora chersina]|uniref:antibiotic biosynthesis monooxygenase family protein n=1 Tax=Micromonospora chersina TaxID=47854 RepID=UPI0037199E89